MDEIVNEPTVEYIKKRYTVQEYLEMENAAVEKHEYFQGEILPLHREVATSMSGAGLNHNLFKYFLFPWPKTKWIKMHLVWKRYENEYS